MQNLYSGPSPAQPLTKSEDEKNPTFKREAGRWLADLRQKAGLSQRDLAKATNCDFYTFISQIENGKGKIPPAKYEAWASALNVPTPLFVRKLLSYYDPITYSILFGDNIGDSESRDAG